MRAYAHDARLMLIANVSVLVATVGTQTLLAWFLLPAGRGQYAAALLFASLLMLLCTLGQEMANVYFVGGKRCSASEAFTQSWLLGGGGSLLAVVLGVLLISFFPDRFTIAPAHVFYVGLAYVPPAVLRLQLAHVLLGLGASRAYTIANLTGPVALCLGLVVAALTFVDVVTALALQAAAEMLGLLLTVLLLMRGCACRFVPLRWAQVRASVGYGARYYVGRLASLTNVQMGAMLLAFMVRDAAMVGLFAAASALFSRIWILAESLQLALLPRAVADAQGRAPLVAQITRLCLVVCTAATLFAFLFAKPLIAILLSPRFLPMHTAVLVLLPGILVRVVAKVLPAYFSGINRPGVTSTAIAVALLVNAGLMLLLLPHWGLVGAAFAMTAAYTVEALILAIAFRTCSGLRLRELFWVSRRDISTMLEGVRRVIGRPVSAAVCTGTMHAR